MKPFAGVALSWIDATTLLPERYRDEADEGGVRKMSDTQHRAAAAASSSIEYRYGETAGKTALPARSATSSTRSRRSTTCARRGSRRATASASTSSRTGGSGGSRRRSRRATEKVETPAGRFETLRVDATTRRVDRPEDRPRPIHLWFGTDARRLPVAIVSEIDVGPVSATLSSVRGAR